jgi:hypothetical protein
MSTTIASAASPSGQALRASSTGVHMDAAQEVDDQDAQAPGRLEQLRASARRPGHARIVERPDQPGFPHDIGQRLFLIPRMIAERQAVGAGVEQFSRGGLGDPKAGGRVLGVDDGEVQGEVAAQARQVFAQALAAGAADHVTEKSQSHAGGLTTSTQPLSVRMPSSG